MLRSLLSCLFVGLLIFHQAEDAAAAHWLGSEFSADVIETFPSGPVKDFQGTIYVSRTHLRKDFIHDEHRVVAILDLLKHRAWLLMPHDKTYFLMDQGDLDIMFGHEPGHVPDMLSDSPCEGRKDLTCKNLGEEEVNGRDTEKWEVESLTIRTSQWIDKRLRIIVREEFPTHIYEIRNIKEESQPKSLFEIPAEYRKLR